MADKPDEKLNEVIVEQALQRQRIDDHDQVLRDLRDLFKGILQRVDSLERKALLLVAVMIAGSENGAAVISKLVGA